MVSFPVSMYGAALVLIMNRNCFKSDKVAEISYAS